MQKVINLLKSEILTRQGAIDLYAYDPHNQAVTKHTADLAKAMIVDLESAISILTKHAEPAADRCTNCGVDRTAEKIGGHNHIC